MVTLARLLTFLTRTAALIAIYLQWGSLTAIGVAVFIVIVRMFEDDLRPIHGDSPMLLERLLVENIIMLMAILCAGTTRGILVALVFFVVYILSGIAKILIYGSQPYY